MSIQHKFKDFNFHDGFITENAILKTNYKPEILILGTFNPLTNDDDNMADFFYGRNWFWTCMFNIFEHNCINLLTQRKFTAFPYNPTINEIKLFCEKYKITFADLISQVLYNNNIEYSLTKNKVSIGQEKYDLINDGDLGKLNTINQVEWTTESLIKFIIENPTIHTIYLTRKPAEPFLTQWKKLLNYNFGRVILFKKIFTPSGQGLKGRPRINCLIQHWLYNNNANYDTLDSNWLTNSGVNINNF